MTTLLEGGTRRAVAQAARRAEAELLLHRAECLQPTSRALIDAYVGHGMSIPELAVLHHTTVRQMRRRIERLRETLTDPCFLLAAQYVDQLPRNLRPLVRAYWLEGLSMRELAEKRGMTLHRIRHTLSVARSLLLVALSGEGEHAKTRAHKALCPIPPGEEE